jgi:hypothetical protein
MYGAVLRKYTYADTIFLLNISVDVFCAVVDLWV